MSRGAGIVYHCSEGQPGSVVAREFTDVAAARLACLKRLSPFTGTQLTDSDWKRWQPIGRRWSCMVTFRPLVIWKHHDVPAARDRGVSICLGSDWGPSGTKHVLAELKVARLVNQKQGFDLKDRDLVAMVTSNAGDVLSRCWSRQIGRLIPGAFADVTVLRRRGNGDVWSQIVAATEREVVLAVVGSVPRYGDADAMTAAGATLTSSLSVGGTKRLAHHC